MARRERRPWERLANPVLRKQAMLDWLRTQLPGPDQTLAQDVHTFDVPEFAYGKPVEEGGKPVELERNPDFGQQKEHDSAGRPADTHVAVVAEDARQIRALFRKEKIRGFDAVELAAARNGLPDEKISSVRNLINRAKKKA